MQILHVFLLFLLSAHHGVSAAPGTLGVNYGRMADNLPPPPQVVQLLKIHKVSKVKIFDTEPTVLTAFAGSGIALTVCLPNGNLPTAAASTAFTDAWVQSELLPYLPSTDIEAVAVGNEVLAVSTLNQFIVPAMKNLQISLAKLAPTSSIKLSSPMAFNALQTSYPSSSGSFKPELVEPVIRPFLHFLNQTSSYLMLNPYPFLAYSAEPNAIPLDYALGNGNAVGNRDPGNGLVYNNILDAQIDAVHAAMAKLGFSDTTIVVTETGWPSVGATLENAKGYNGNLARRVLNGAGTPLKPDHPLNVFIFALFNEDNKPGAVSERNYGLFYPSQQRVYDIPLSSSQVQNATVVKGRNLGAARATKKGRF